MWQLSRIFLHNWHRFNNHELEIEGSLFLTGHNGSGKSSILDALQLVLVADLNRVRFNASAQDRSERGLDSYVRGKIGEDRYLRPGNTVGYVAVEFLDTERLTHQTFGVCIEASPHRSPDRTFFVMDQALVRSTFLVQGLPLSRRELKLLIRGKTGSLVLDQVKEYQAEVLDRLGGLSERYFDVFLRALAFQPMRDIRQFVEQWILARGGLDISTLKTVTERLHDLKNQAQEYDNQQRLLSGIVVRQDEVKRLRNLHGDNLVATAVLKTRAASSQLACVRSDLLEVETKRVILSAAVEDLRQTEESMRADHLEKSVLLRQSDGEQKRIHLQKQLQNEKLLLAQVEPAGKRAVERLRALLFATSEWSPELEHSVRAQIESHLNQALDLTGSSISGQWATLKSSLLHLQQRLNEPLRLAIERSDEVRSTLQGVISEGRQLEAQLMQLQTSTRPLYRRELEDFREMLRQATGSKQPVLCELLEIPEEKWQAAVEAMLGNRRFLIVPEPDFFNAAVHLLAVNRVKLNLQDIGLLDLARAQKEARVARPGTLAQQVRAADPRIGAYINHILGEIVTCESHEELSQHRRSVTPDVMTYSEWSVRSIPKSRFHPFYIGGRTKESQFKSLNEQLDPIRDQIVVLGQAVNGAKTLVDSISGWSNIEEMLSGLDQAQRAESLRAAIAALTHEGERLTADLGDTALRQTVATLETALSEVTIKERQSVVALTKLEAEQADLQRGQLHLEEHISILRPQLEQALITIEPDSSLRVIRLTTITEMVDERLLENSLEEAQRNTEATTKGFETRAGNELQKLVEEATAFNISFRFVGKPNDPFDEGFSEEMRRLGAVELPKYREDIAREEARAEHELREHVLHRLREQIATAKSQIDRLNRAVSSLSFRGERYRFKWYPAEDMHEYYRLISETKSLGSNSLLESAFYKENSSLFEKFYERLTRTPKSDHERQDQERLTDYRSYLGYDIEVIHADGQVSRLSRIAGQTSGGEGQTPFYLAIAASFLQLFESCEKLGRKTLRLVAFDEAFSKMDQQRIGATLDLFHEFGLQVITATPLERCEYLAPKMRTNLVVTAIGDHVIIDPYRNYASPVH